MQKAMQTVETRTVAFRVPVDRKHEVYAAAARRNELPSDWLRRAVEQALEEEHLALGWQRRALAHDFPGAWREHP